MIEKTVIFNKKMLLGCIFVGSLACVFPAYSQAPPLEVSLPLVNTTSPPAWLTRQSMQAYPLDLATVLKLTEAQNLTIAADQASLKISQSLVHQSIANLLPNIEASVAQSRLKGGTQVFEGQTIRVLRDTVQPQITAVWTINPGGQDVFAMLAARQRQKVSDLQLTQTLQAQLSGAAQDYFALLSAQANREQVAQSIVEAQAQVNLNETRLTIGKGNRLDLLKSQTLLADQQQLLIEADVAIATAEQTLLNRLNLEPNLHLDTRQEDQAEHTLLDASWTREGLLETARQHNPSYQKSEKALKALGLDFKAVRAQMIPSVTLRTYVAGTGSDWNNLTRAEFGGFTANLNLLEGLGLKIPFQMEQKRAEIQKAVIDLKSVERNIETQVMTAYFRSQAYAAAIRTASQDRDLAQETYDVSVARFKAGFGTNLDVADAIVSLAQARTKLVQTVLNYNQAQVKLVEALGQVSADTLIHGVTAHVR